MATNSYKVKSRLRGHMLTVFLFSRLLLLKQGECTGHALAPVALDAEFDYN